MSDVTREAERREAMQAVHSGIFATYPVSVMEAVGYTQDGYDRLLDAIAESLAAHGFTRRPMPSREQVARAIYDCDDLERAVLADAEHIADAVLALLEGKSDE